VSDVFMEFSTGRDGREYVSIDAEEVAAFEGFQKVSYTYEKWTRVTLRNGTVHECYISYPDFKKRLVEARSAV
jgi:hypothetical protein